MPCVVGLKQLNVVSEIVVDQIHVWRGLAIDRAVAQGKDVERFRHDETSLFWWYADLAVSEKNPRPSDDEYLYWELYRDQASASWIVLGAVFDARLSGQAKVQPFVVNSAQAAGEGAHIISFGFASDHLPHAYGCDIAVHLCATGMYQIRSASVTVVQLDPAGPPKLTTQISEDFSISDSPDGTAIDQRCPVCGGAGFVNTYTIPKEERERGLSGYELWSCNTINCAVACVNCGGEGKQFKEWYLDEEPERRLALPTYRSGTGRFRAQRPPASGSLHGGQTRNN